MANRKLTMFFGTSLTIFIIEALLFFPHIYQLHQALQIIISTGLGFTLGGLVCLTLYHALEE